MDGPMQAVADFSVPPGDVLAVIADLAAYPQWVAGTNEVEVLETDDAGRPLRARFAVAGGPLRGSWTLAYTWATTPAGTGTVSWSLVAGDALRRLDGSHTLKAIGGGTRLVHQLAVQLRLPVAGPLRRRAEKLLVDRVVTDLRARVEARAAEVDGAETG